MMLFTSVAPNGGRVLRTACPLWLLGLCRSWPQIGSFRWSFVLKTSHFLQWLYMNNGFLVCCIAPQPSLCPLPRFSVAAHKTVILNGWRIGFWFPSTTSIFDVVSVPYDVVSVSYFAAPFLVFPSCDFFRGWYVTSAKLTGTFFRCN